MIKIIVDTLGGDHSPDANIEGSIMALNKIYELELILAGNEIVILEKLKNYSYDKNRLSILNAPDEISCNDKPTDAIKQKVNSSLVKSFELLKSDDSINAFVSNGSTGALIAGTVLKIGRIKGVKRPALCPVIPAMNSNNLIGICDSGANVDCDAIQLNQFATMCSLYMQKNFNVSSPRVALLNVGTEEEKGDLLRKEAFSLLKENPKINFVGNMESRDLLSGDFDVVVADGFSGNVLLKSTEGSFMEALKTLKNTFTKNLKTKIGASLLKKEIYELKDSMNYNNYGGAVLLGAKKTIIKAHGSSNATAICICIEQAYNIEKSNLRLAIEEAMQEKPEPIESTQNDNTENQNQENLSQKIKQNQEVQSTPQTPANEIQDN